LTLSAARAGPVTLFGQDFLGFDQGDEVAVWPGLGCVQRLVVTPPKSDWVTGRPHHSPCIGGLAGNQS
jgi:hypothetical protein